jgi:enoyl-CoA hydratase/carnithine racemase
LTYFDEDDVAAEADVVVVDDDASFNDPEDGINVTPGNGEAVLDATPTESLSNE